MHAALHRNHAPSGERYCFLIIYFYYFDLIYAPDSANVKICRSISAFCTVICAPFARSIHFLVRPMADERGNIQCKLTQVKRIKS